MTLNHQLLDKIIGILLFIFPAMFILVNKGGDILLLIMLVIHIIYLAVNRRDKFPYSSEEKILFLVISLYLGLQLLNNFFVGSKALESDGITLFIMLLPLFHHIRRSVIDRKYIIYGVLAGAVACFIMAIYQKYMLGIPRVSGFFKIIAFGWISMTMSLMCLWAAILSESKKLCLLMVGGFILACIASLLSGSRGPWLSIISCLVFLLLFNPKSWGIKKKVIITLSSLILISASYFAMPEVQQRVSQATSEIDSYFSSGVVNNSVGLRLEVWRAALISIGEKPWEGIGSENFDEMIAELSIRGEIDPIMSSNISHVHNEYLTAALHRGIPGLATLLLIYLVPFYVFVRHYRSASADDQMLLGYGMIMIVSSMTVSMTDLFFQHHRESLFFVFYIFVIYGLALPRSKSKTTEQAQA